jgi:hypothetical protein
MGSNSEITNFWDKGYKNFQSVFISNDSIHQNSNSFVYCITRQWAHSMNGKILTQ